MAGWGGLGAFQDRLHGILYSAVNQAVARIAHLETEWSEAEISKRVVRYFYKGASDPELLNMPWEEACKEIVQRSMNGYSAACGECAWFYDIDLVPTLEGAALAMFAASGQAAPPGGVHEIIQAEYEDKLDRMLLDKALWEVISSVFSEEKVRSKVFHAMSRAYWPALDEILGDGHLHRELMYGLDPDTELRRVEAFVKRWLDDGICRAWLAIEQSAEGLNQATLLEFLKQLVEPFGSESPFSCLPGALTENLGRPPSDWKYMKTVVNELFRSWSNGAAAAPKGKKRRKAGGGGGQAADEEEDGIIRPRAKAKTAVVRAQDAEGPIDDLEAGGEEQVEEEKEAPEEGSHGHPQCTSADDCIGTTLHPLVRHLHNGKAGDLYCEPCWESFRQRNPSLQGVLESE